MVLSEHVRITDSIRQRREEVFGAVRTNRECQYLYCITLPSNERNLLEIHPYRELHKRKEYDRPYIILGLAENRKEAVNMVFEMVSEVAASIEKPEDFKKAFILYRDHLIPDEWNRKE